MNRYWPVRPANSSMSRRTCSGVNTIQLTTASKVRSPIAARTDAGSEASAVRTSAPSGTARSLVRPRLRTVTSSPWATASRTQEVEIRPVPPMNSTLTLT
nr:hypothetical protein GCM10025732_42970 [Glycomyces mayteni]